MKSLILLLTLVGCASTGGSVTKEGDGSLLIRVAPSRVANCKANGGCGLYSRAELEEMVREAVEAGARMSCPDKSKVLL